jgi:hypothetical protein
MRLQMASRQGILKMEEFFNEIYMSNGHNGEPFINLSVGRESMARM